jgi:hypothetical protein
MLQQPSRFNLFCVVAFFPTLIGAQQPANTEREFTANVRPILVKYCVECHSKELTEAEINLDQFTEFPQLAAHVEDWLKVRVMLKTRQMPPKESKQPNDGEYRQLETWVQTFLAAEAKKHAGDPGPVVLRRLSNDEYNYSLRDLTGIDSLDPTREFPIDGAAGEGFTNTGSGQGMSPALIAKYLDAAKEVADHVVLLPDGIRFSSRSSRRDHTDELLAEIRQTYGRYTDSSENGGKIPLAKYIALTITERTALQNEKGAVERLSQAHQLSPTYLRQLFEALDRTDDSSIILDQIRKQWRSAKPEEADVQANAVAASIGGWQNVLWKFNTIGHIGRQGGPPSWLEGVTPIASQQDYRIELPQTDEKEVIVYLSAGDVGDGNDEDLVVWQSPQLIAVNQPAILLRDAAGIPKQVSILREEMLSQVVAYLTAAHEASPQKSVEDLAQLHQVDPILLQAWLDYLNIGIAGPVTISGHFVNQMKNSGNYDFIQSWGTGDTPLISANSSDQQVRVPGIARPHGVLAHPSPTLFCAIGWQSPVTGKVTIDASLSDAHPECGNGVEWYLQHESRGKSATLWRGDFPQGGKANMPAVTVEVRKGEVISFKLGPRQGSHACDLTAMDMHLTEVGGKGRVWDLSKDVSDDILAANPHADLHGNPAVWHFYKGEMKNVEQRPAAATGVPNGSILATWLKEADGAKRAELAKSIQSLLSDKRPEDDSPDRMLYDQLTGFPIPLDHDGLLENVEKDPRFGRQPNSKDAAELKSSDLVVQAPAVIELRIPASVAAGRTLVTTARIQPGRGDGSVQTFATVGKPASLEYSMGSPIVVTPNSPAEKRVVAGLNDFRNLFPASTCYDRIVPIDEVVTLTLFYREDDHFKRLLLNENERQALDRLWDELHFVSQEPLQYLVALEQIREFATQDRPDLVVAFEANIKPANERAEAFRQFQIEAEATQIDGIILLAAKAWRRKASPAEQAELRTLYQQLRGSDLSHDKALKLTLARILASPEFLYKIENPPQSPQPAHRAAPVSNQELATRLSYFLWSSIPDAALRASAEGEDLTSDDVLRSQTRRMLQDEKTRRLAIQFACQWLHLRNFDQNDDKNEKLYPEFSELRDDMYEETVVFFEDMFRNNGSILHLLDADHTFLNETLASHYGITGVTGPQWRRVSGLRKQGRGGVLGMATVLASQSGASRTSPILRGNWISETLLGERLPRPPADVPQLPESVPEGLTARQLIERHSSDPACATCHARIDPYGFALENFDAIGRSRPGPVDTKTTLLEGEQIEGLQGIREYLVTKRRDDVVRQFCRKLLGFALGRELQLSDEPLVDKMLVELKANEFRFQVAVEQIVLSQQFRQIRGSE